MMKERAYLSERVRILTRELSLLQEAGREWAEQGAEKNVDLKKLTGRVEELESSLATEKRERAMERLHTLKTHDKQTEEMRLELDGLRSLIKLKNRELRTLKRLAALVLHQRSDVEQFFLDALAEVKLEIARRKKAEASAALMASKTGLERAGVTLSFNGSSSSASAGGKGAGSAAGLSSTKAGKFLAGKSAGLTLITPKEVVLGGSADGSWTGGAAGAGGGGGGGLAAITLPQLAQRTAQLSKAAMAAGHSSSGASYRGAGAAADTGAAAGGEEDEADSDARLAEKALGSGPGRIDIAELSPEDKEQVLRLLFAKINSLAVRAPNTGNAAATADYPAHAAAAQHHQQQQQAVAFVPGSARSNDSMGSADMDTLAAFLQDTEAQEQEDAQGGGAGDDAGAGGIAGPFGLSATIPEELRNIDFGLQQQMQQHQQQQQLQARRAAAAGSAPSLFISLPGAGHAPSSQLQRYNQAPASPIIGQGPGGVTAAAGGRAGGIAGPFPAGPKPKFSLGALSNKGAGAGGGGGGGGAAGGGIAVTQSLLQEAITAAAQGRR